MRQPEEHCHDDRTRPQVSALRDASLIGYVSPRGSGPRLSTRLRTAIMFCRAWGLTAAETHVELSRFSGDFNLSLADEEWLRRTNADRTIRRYFSDRLGPHNSRLLTEAQECVTAAVRALPIASKEGRL